MRFPTYPPDMLSRADALLSEKYGTDKPIDPLLVEIACEAMMMEQERIAAVVDALAVRMSESSRHKVESGLVGEVLDILAKAIRGASPSLGTAE